MSIELKKTILAQQETIRCMTLVLDGIAKMLGVETGDVDGLAWKIEQLQAKDAEIEQCRKDAARYQWLKSRHFKIWSPDMGGNHVWSGIGRPIGTGPTLDAAIDKALAGGGK
jgi:hypothetical protein